MFEKIKNFLKESESQSRDEKEEKKIYDFEEREDKKLKKINFLDRIKFIKFNKIGDKSKNLSSNKIKEVRSFGYSSTFNRNWICEFF